MNRSVKLLILTLIITTLGYINKVEAQTPYWTQGTPFTGYFMNGTTGDPDLLCTFDTAVYNLVPPSNYANSDYGTKWNVQSIVITNSATGSVNKDTTTFKPSSGNPYRFRFTPKSTAGGISFMLKAVVRDIVSNTDYTIYRYMAVGHQPTAWFTFTAGCYTNAVNFADSSYITQGFIGRKFDFGDGTSSTVRFPLKKYSQPGTYTVKLTVTSDRGCTDVVTRNVTVYGPPKVNFGYAAGCLGKATQFFDSTVTDGKIKTWLWKFGDGTTSTLSSPTHTYAKAQSYNVTLVVESSFGCKDSIIKTIKVLESPTAGYTFQRACLYSPVTFKNMSTSPNGTTMTYKWYFDDGTTSTEAEPSHIYTNVRPYDVKLVVTSSTGCKDSITKEVNLFPNPIVKFGPETPSVCKGIQVVFKDSTSFGSKYEWEFGDGSKATGLPGRYTYNTTGIFTVKLRVTSDSGCIDSSTRTVTVHEVPVANFSATTVCIGKPTNFTNTSTVKAGASYKWTLGDGTISTEKDPIYTYKNSGKFTVKLEVTNPGGCTESKILDVFVNPAPIITFKALNITSRQIQFVPSDTTFKTYNWNFGDSTNSTEKMPKHTYNVLKGKFVVKLEVTDAKGCKAVYIDTACVGAGCKLGLNETSVTSNLSIYPNPFSGKTTLSFDLSNSSDISIDLYDMTGKKVALIDQGKKSAGTHNYTIDADKLDLVKGIYMLRIRANDQVYNRQIIYNR